MAIPPKYLGRPVPLCLLAFLAFAAVGCGQPERASPLGVLSAMHQRALNAATTRAIEQAGIDQEFVGPGRTYIDVKAVGSADLGKQHVAGAVIAEIDAMGADITDDAARADSNIACFINVAGTDPDEGGFLFWNWKEVKADVQLTFTRTAGASVTKKQGVGTAVYSETWFLGMGPETKIK